MVRSLKSSYGEGREKAAIKGNFYGEMGKGGIKNYPGSWPLN